MMRAIGSFLATAAIPIAIYLSFPPHRAVAGEFVDEMKIGVFNHDIAFLGHHKESGVDINLETLLASPDLLAIIGAPRPDLGVMVNSAGKTDQLYGGLTWTVGLAGGLFIADDGIFLSGSLGGAGNNGKLDGTWRDHKILGSNLLFRESAEFGYRLRSRYSLSLIVDHSSDGGLSDHNQGLTDAGARFGVMF